VSFLVSAIAATVTIFAAVLPPIGAPGFAGGQGAHPPFPAPPGYLLPWTAGQIHTITQAEETTFTHNGSSAYAFDFNLNFDSVIASRGGTVTFVRTDSNVGGCSSAFSKSANYVVIDHGDGTSALYLHLAESGVFVRPGDVVAQGQIIAASGESGLTCSDDKKGPGPHLHFQVERTEPGRYFTQSLPIAFDDIAANDGVPQDGKSYVSANVEPGTPQMAKLTPHHYPRRFAPIAAPADPTLIEGEHVIVPPMIGAVPPLPEPAPTDAATVGPEPTITPRPARRPTHTPTPNPTATAAPSDTPLPAPTATDTPIPAPAATDTPPPAPAATDTPPPAATATAAPIATDTPAPPPAPSATPTP
jgi:hypothetical protein